MRSWLTSISSRTGSYGRPSSATSRYWRTRRRPRRSTGATAVGRAVRRGRRGVERSEQFCRCYHELAPHMGRLDEILEGIEWSIMVHPEGFTRVPDTKLWLAWSDPFHNAPSLAVYFLIDNPGQCTMVWVEEATGLES
jgi:hypothetical protein